MVIVSPSVLIHRHLNTLFGHLPGSFDGDVESVHQARVATRRLSELLPLVDGDTQGIVKKVRAARRCLGRVRELDVMGALLETLSERMVPTAAVAAIAKSHLHHRQQNERREMVKRLERLELEDLRDVFARAGRFDAWSLGLLSLIRRPEWIEALWARIVSRSTDAVDAVRDARGVYFPKRAHQARIAVKKLRYAVEVAADSGIWRPHRLLKDLRRIQGTLGQIHDAQVLADAIGSLVPGHVGSVGVMSLEELLEREITRHQAEYMKRRDRLFAIADGCTRTAAEARDVWRPRRAVVAMAVVATPLLLRARRHVGQRADTDPLRRITFAAKPRPGLGRHCSRWVRASARWGRHRS